MPDHYVSCHSIGYVSCQSITRSMSISYVPYLLVTFHVCRLRSTFHVPCLFCCLATFHVCRLHLIMSIAFYFTDYAILHNLLIFERSIDTVWLCAQNDWLFFYRQSIDRCLFVKNVESNFTNKARISANNLIARSTRIGFDRLQLITTTFDWLLLVLLFTRPTHFKP